ncbi:DNA methylase [Sulfolobales archaeon HS-7]|nr:DNA methylase [Sulfolobales archaeon HS-7]
MPEGGKLIERGLPELEKINEEARREKTGGRYPISELNFWWARKPLVVSRAMILGSILDNDEEFIRLMIKGNEATVENPIPKDVIKRFENLTLLDPFAGGGSIPFEGLRLGLKVIANDYNPVAWALLKALDIREELVNVKEWERISKKYKRGFTVDMEDVCTKEDKSKLGKLVDLGCKIILGVKQKNEKLFPDFNGKRVAAYLWFRETDCPNCGAKIPITSSWYLKKVKSKEKLYLSIEYKGDDYIVEIEEGETKASPTKASNKEVMCPRCNYSIPEKELVSKISKEPNRARLLIIMTEDKEFHLARPEDSNLPQVSESPINVEVIQDKVVSASRYGFRNYAEMFNKRQLKVLSELIEEIRKQVPKEEAMLRLYLSFLVSKHGDHNSFLTHWHSSYVVVGDTMAFRRPAMTWNVVEVNPFSLFSGSLWSMFCDIVEACAFIQERVKDNPNYTLLMKSAEDLPISDGSIDLIVTDPPYYDDVQYAEISDFFYALMKPVLEDVYPENFHFSSLWRERSMEEMSVGPGRNRNFFEMKFKTVLNFMKRVLKDDGIIAMFYAHKRPEFWISVLQAIVESGFTISNTIPVHTEQESSSVSRGKVAMQTSVVMVLRKRKEDRQAFVEDLKSDIERAITTSIKRAIEKGYKGADIMLAGIGASLSVATQYSNLLAKRKDVKPFDSVIEMVYEVAPVKIVNFMTNKNISAMDSVTKLYLFTRVSDIYIRKDSKGIKVVISSDELINLTRGFPDLSVEYLEKEGIIKRSSGKEKSDIELLNFKNRVRFGNKERIIIDAYHYLLRRFEEEGKKGVEKEITSTIFTFSPQELCNIAEILSVHGPDDEEKKASKEYLLQICNKRIDDNQVTLDSFFK